MLLNRFFPRLVLTAPLSIFVATALVACGGGGGGGAAVTLSPTQPTTVATEKNLTASESGELLSYVKERLKAQPTAENVSTTGGPVALAAGNPASGVSGTTLQEQGVDEDDLIKTDGSFIYALGYNLNGLNGATLSAYQRAVSGSVTKLGSLTFPGANIADQASVGGIFLFESPKKIVAVGSAQGATMPTVSLPNYSAQAAKVQLTVVDVSTPSALSISRTLKIDGNLISSRRIGNYLYLVTTWRPALNPEPAAIASLNISAVLPNIQVNTQAPVPLISDTDCYVQTKNAASDIQLTTITAIDLASPDPTRNSRCFAGGTEAAYVSDASVYLSTTRYAYTPTPQSGVVNSGGASPAIALWRYPESIKTDIHKFSLSGLTLNYKASAQVEGHLGWQQDKKSYRMSEYKGDLRVLTFTGSAGWGEVRTQDPASPATLTVLREVGANLEKIGSLPSTKRPAPIGLPNEQVYAVRLLGERGYVVTFRQTDPLYMLDLSDPTDPKTIGELKAPGYSDYIYPIGVNLILGVGKDATTSGLVQGVKVALYDVSNPEAIVELATKSIGKRGSTSALDTSSHGINLFTTGDTTRVALPIRVVDGNPVNQSLYRFEVNSQAKTLSEKPSILGNAFATVNSSSIPGVFDNIYVGYSRSVQINDNIYFLHGGTVSGHLW
jgi:Beta propeller domain